MFSMVYVYLGTSLLSKKIDIFLFLKYRYKRLRRLAFHVQKMDSQALMLP